MVRLDDGGAGRDGIFRLCGIGKIEAGAHRFRHGRRLVQREGRKRRAQHGNDQHKSREHFGCSPGQPR